ncbi:hypothetical protein OAL19_00735 [bacterium]|nr:hypothetical protein [bacterium]
MNDGENLTFLDEILDHYDLSLDLDLISSASPHDVLVYLSIHPQIFSIALILLSRVGSYLNRVFFVHWIEQTILMRPKSHQTPSQVPEKCFSLQYPTRLEKLFY